MGRFFLRRLLQRAPRHFSGCGWGKALMKVTRASEAESFLPVPERRVKTPLIEAQSTAIARAMARICNDEQG